MVFACRPPCPPLSLSPTPSLLLSSSADLFTCVFFPSLLFLPFSLAGSLFFGSLSSVLPPYRLPLSSAGSPSFKYIYFYFLLLALFCFIRHCFIFLYMLFSLILMCVAQTQRIFSFLNALSPIRLRQHLFSS